MKKICRMVLCMVFVLMAAGCSIGGTKESIKWIDESAEMISDEITSGEFVIDGVAYQFPMPLKFWLEHGWRISEEYGNADDLVLGIGYSSGKFKLVNEKNISVEATVINNTYTEALLKECMVNSLDISTIDVDVVLPQGITKRNKPADVLEKYGDADLKKDGNQIVKYFYEFEDSILGQCYFQCSVYDNNYTNDPLVQIHFGTRDFGNYYWDKLKSSVGEEEACKIYFNASLEASFYGVYDAYLNYGIAPKSLAETIRTSLVESYAEVFRQYTDINADYFSDDERNRLIKVAEAVLAKTKWEVKRVEIDNFGDGELQVDLYPTNFFTLADDDVKEAVATFYERYTDVDFGSLTKEEWVVVQAEYVELMLEALEKNIAEAGTLPAVERTYTLDTKEGIMLEENWIDAENVLMGLR